jgi:hypothetical protein
VRRAPHAGRLRRRPHPERQDRPRAADRRHDLGRGLGADRGPTRSIVRYGSLLNQDLASYLVPVQADIGEVDAIMLDEVDDKANPMGIKGVGELGNSGAGAAVANAVYNACGVRVRDYPITPDKLLGGADRQRALRHPFHFRRTPMRKRDCFCRKLNSISLRNADTGVDQRRPNVKILLSVAVLVGSCGLLLTDWAGHAFPTCRI